MSNATNNTKANATPRSSQHSRISTSNAFSPTWGPPKAPLPPHRLAKLANALGVATPMPAVHIPSPMMSSSYTGSATPLDQYRRSPTPSAASSHNVSSYTPSSSKYLLHVIPPLHLPHDSDSYDTSELTPPPSNASGYHTQFRRGTLVSVHATLQSQLGAIAKEYALPSTTGIILYLVNSTRGGGSQRSLSPNMGIDENDMEEPGPRLSEDIWKHLWTRVAKAEQRDETMLLPSRSPTPNMYGLGIGAATHSTPQLQQDPGQPQPLRPLITTKLGVDGAPLSHPTIPYPITPSTPSTTSDMRFHTKSAPPSSSSVSPEPDTPDTSSHSHSFLNHAMTRANSLDLPGLGSSSVIPILAKVEFDIDRRKAGWFEPWLRSRRMNHAKRAESRTGQRKNSVADSVGGNDEAGLTERETKDRKPPLGLLTVRKQTASPASLFRSPAGDSSDSQSFDLRDAAGYEPLPDAQEDEGAGSEGGEEMQEEDEEFEDATARVSSFPGAGGKDPLDEVFGSDADTWADLHSSSRPTSNRNVVNLALTGADLASLPDEHEFEDDERMGGREEDEVQELLDQMSRPQLAVSIPPSPPTKRSSSPSTQSSRKHVPPPLVLAPMPGGDLAIPEPSPMPSSAGSTNLAYLNLSPGDERSRDDIEVEGADEDYEDQYTRVRSPEESEKRGGAVYDELDLGLDPTEDFDEYDPNDRRRSQYVMSAKLDEIERTMAQLSPRILKSDLPDEEEQSFSFHSASLSPNLASHLVPSPGGLRNADVFPPSPRLPNHPEFDDSNHASDSDKQAAWPATPFSALNENTMLSPPRANRANLPPSPPRLAVNGITTSAPKSYTPNIRSSANEVSAETEKRKRELEEEHMLYPAFGTPTGNSSDSHGGSPVIPLSPDPFGRYPSTPEPPEPSGSSKQSSSYWDAIRPPRGPPVSMSALSHGQAAEGHTRNHSTATSRFSADSMTGAEPPTPAKPANRSTLMTIKKFWRKSNKNSISEKPPPTPTLGRISPSPSLRPSQDSLEPPQPPTPALPVTPTFGRFSPQPPPIPPASTPAPPRPERPSAEDLPNLSPEQHRQQLYVPFAGRNGNAGPIVAAQMQHGRGGNLDRLQFDQESPYPIRRAPVPSRQPPQPPMPSDPPPTEQPGVRKSILKSWNKTPAGHDPQSQAHIAEFQPRASLERPGANGANRTRRPSVLHFGSSRGSATSPPPDLPASPPIPDHFNVQGRKVTPPDQRQSIRSKMTSSSIDSNEPPRSHSALASVRSASPSRSRSSKDSGETRPSFDVSQFEIVSPKMNSTLSYPYHALDHEH